jgi:ubiquinone/menaquinone biosynthesis C-methylase UbiE
MASKNHNYLNTKDYYNKVSGWRSTGFLKGWTGAIAKRRVLPGLKALHFREDDTWLDMGCGPGFNILLGLKINAKKKISCYGIDLAEQNIKFAQKRIPSGKFQPGKVEDLPYADNFFDKVTYFHVIEHVANPLRSMEELKRVLKHGGKASISFQNKYGLENLTMGLSKKLIFFFGGDKAGFSKPAGVLDVRRSYFELKALCFQSGLRIVQTNGCIVMLPSIAWRFKLFQKPTLFLSDLLEKLPLIKYLSSYISLTVVKS